MNANWKLLVQAGLPDGAAPFPSGQTIGDSVALRRAVQSVAASNLDPTDKDVLAAWLAAFSHHWPSAFAEILGEVGHASLRTLTSQVEPNRYLKFRRIAIANLAKILA